MMVIRTLGLLATLGLAATAHAQGGYEIDAAGTVWRTGYGQCWRTSQWTPAHATADCDAHLLPKPEARKPDPAPAPVAAPPPPPPPAPAPAAAPAPAPAPPPAPVVAAAPLDSDGDGVVDPLDKCPGTPAGVKVNVSGCPLPEVIVLKGVTFATDSAALTPQSMAVLDEAAAAFVRNPGVKAEVAGHTDNTGPAARNRVLSQQRAESVMRYLVSKGASPANLSARGYGPDKPIADNRSSEGRSANRRVELRILQ